MTSRLSSHSPGLRTSLLLTCCGEYNGNGQGTGGLVCIHDGEAMVVDRLDSTGLCWDGGWILRFVRAEGQVWGYAADGRVVFRLALPDVKNGHDVRLVDGQLVVMSTGENQVHWYDLAGRLVTFWQAPGEGDAWHLNCLHKVGKALYASAFGMFQNHRDWHDRGQMSGFVFNLATEDRVLGSLWHPHSPRKFDGRWMACESGTGSLVVKEKVSRRVRRVALEGYPRGMDAHGDYLYVGESTHRGEDHGGSVAVLNRWSLEVVDRLAIPLPEVYEVLAVPDSFARALMKGA